MEKKRKFRQEYFITNMESFEWYLIVIELNEADMPINSYIIRIPQTDERFKIYPYIKN
jgi:hypothetical protein